jgi:hypothetical protein
MNKVSHELAAFAVELLDAALAGHDYVIQPEAGRQLSTYFTDLSVAARDLERGAIRQPIVRLSFDHRGGRMAVLPPGGGDAA